MSQRQDRSAIIVPDEDEAMMDVASLIDRSLQDISGYLREMKDL